MGRIRRRRTKYTWFPLLGFQGANPEDNSTLVPITPAVVPGSGALSDVTLFPLVPDSPNDTPAAATDHLDDFIASEYVLKRIVGRFWCTASAFTGPAGNQITSYAVGLGFFVARAERTAGGFAVPVGAATAVERKENYGPLNIENTREPWIWRRIWLLSRQEILNGINVGGRDGYPANNLNGSVAEGSHIDAKTGRRITNDDRLWAAVQSVALVTVGTPADFQSLDHQMDIRVLGALRKARNRSAF